MIGSKITLKQAALLVGGLVVVSSGVMLLGGGGDDPLAPTGPDNAAPEKYTAEQVLLVSDPNGTDGHVAFSEQANILYKLSDGGGSDASYLSVYQMEPNQSNDRASTRLSGYPSGLEVSGQTAYVRFNDPSRGGDGAVGSYHPFGMETWKKSILNPRKVVPIGDAAVGGDVIVSAHGKESFNSNSDERLLRLDGGNGSIEWSVQGGDWILGVTNSTLYTTGDMTYEKPYPNRTLLVARDIETGDVKWMTRIPNVSRIQYAPSAAVGETLYMVSQPDGEKKGSLMAIRGGEVVWKADNFTSTTKQDIYSDSFNPVKDGDTVYIGADAYDVDTGKVKFKNKGRKNRLYNGVLYYYTGNTVHAADPSTGEELWKYNPTHDTGMQNGRQLDYPKFYGDKYVAVAMDGLGASNVGGDAVILASSAPVAKHTGSDSPRTHSQDRSIGSLSTVDTANLYGAVSKPAVGPSKSYVTVKQSGDSCRFKLAAIKGGSVVWQSATFGPPSRKALKNSGGNKYPTCRPIPPSVNDGTVVATANYGSVVAYTKGGERLWNRTFNLSYDQYEGTSLWRLNHKPLVSGNRVVLTATEVDGYKEDPMVVLNAKTGAIVREEISVKQNAPPALRDGRFYFGTGSRRLLKAFFKYDAKTGRMVRHSNMSQSLGRPFGDPAEAAPAITENKAIYLSNVQGRPNIPAIRAYDRVTLEQEWRVSFEIPLTSDGPNVATAWQTGVAVTQGNVYVGSNAGVHAVSLDGEHLWNRTKDITGPADTIHAAKNRIYVGSKKNLVVLDASNGKVVNKPQIPAPVVGISGAHGRVVVTFKDGTVRTYD